jgi:DNA-binding NtrC family response regulator
LKFRTVWDPLELLFAGYFAAMPINPQSRILVVDDELLIRWSLSEALTAAGYAVVEGRDAAEARLAIRDQAHKPDLVVLDYRLPDSNDLGLLTTIRHEAPTVPVILMTAYGTAEVVKGALDLGAYRVVSKPFEVHDMASLVTEALAAR